MAPRQALKIQKLNEETPAARPHRPVVSSAAWGCRPGGGLRPGMPSNSSWHGEGPPHPAQKPPQYIPYLVSSPALLLRQHPGLLCIQPWHHSFIHLFRTESQAPATTPGTADMVVGMPDPSPVKKRRNKMPEMSGRNSRGEALQKPHSRVRAWGNWGGWCAARTSLPEKVIFEGGREAMCLAGGGEFQAAGTASAKAPRQEESRPASVAGAEVR